MNSKKRFTMIHPGILTRERSGSLLAGTEAVRRARQRPRARPRARGRAGPGRRMKAAP